MRTKLVFALVGVSLGSMLALGAFTYRAAGEMLRESALERLESLAETKKQDLEKVVVAWRDRVELIASRTQLRLSLRAHSLSGEPSERERIVRILGDALDSVPAVRGLAVFDARGGLVASVGEPTEPSAAPPDLEGATAGTSIYAGFDPGGTDDPTIHLLAPLRLDGAIVGSLRARLDAQEVVSVTEDTTGLGASGETLIARAIGDGGAWVLTPRRHDAAGAPRRVAAGDRRDPVLLAAAGEQSVFQEDALDYRGTRIWAATRYLDELGWGIVVKMDEAELLEPVGRLRETIWKLSVSLSAFGIVVATLLGIYFARPIQKLAEVAGRIADGDHSLRAESRSEDEVGQLAEAFNRMAGELIDTNKSLQEQLEGVGRTTETRKTPSGSSGGRSV